jgi:hypothetical protein
MIEALIKLANLLDEQGATKEADLVDALIQKATKETKTETPKEESIEDVFTTLSGIADKLDSIGIVEGANLIDGFIQKTAEDVMKWKDEDKKTEQAKRYDSKYHHSLQIREPKKDQERVDREGRQKHHVSTYQQTNATALSTRHCPDHIGYDLGRIGENTYQCSLDGQVYNWEAGWTDYQGNKHPGGSVAGQTPDSTGYAIPHRIFDSRENSLNRVN